MSDEMETVGNVVVRAGLAAADAWQKRWSPEELAAYEEGCARERRRKLLRASGIESSLTADDAARVVDDACTSTGALDLVQRWLLHVAEARARRELPAVRVLVLAGPVGVGKTVAAAWALAREGGRHAAFDDLAVSFASKYSPDRAKYLRARSMPFLHLDEVLFSPPTDEHRAALHDLVHHRQRGQLTLITGNFGPPQWDALVDERTQQRLDPMYRLRAVKGASMRQRIAGARPDLERGAS